MGPRGVYRNVSIPGTGIWDRQRIGGPSQPSGIPPPATDYSGTIPSLPPSIPVSPPTPATEIHSASTELLTSESLENLRRLLTDAFNERDQLTKEVSSATLESNSATRRYQEWERGFLMKRLFKNSFATRREVADTTVAKLEELQEQLRLTTVATEITVDREQAEPYYRMRDEFAALYECKKIWNVLEQKKIVRVAERRIADTAVTRTPVLFRLGSCDLMEWDKTVPHLQNETGGDMYLYPGFILYRASKEAFALIDFCDVSLKFVSTEFTEPDILPADAKVIGKTWAKSNKDGTPDRRFANNYQIPVVLYGSLLFSTQDGLDVRYLCSSAALVERFAKAWTAFRSSLGGCQESGGDNTNEPLRTFRKFRDAFGKFKSAGETFSGYLVNAAAGHEGKAPCSARMPKEVFVRYMATAVDLIAAAKELEERSNVPSSTRANFQRAIGAFEVARTSFVNSVLGGNTDPEDASTFLGAVGAFMRASKQFQDTLTGGRPKGRRRATQAN